MSFFFPNIFGTNFVRAFYRVRAVKKLFFSEFAPWDHTQVRAVKRNNFFLLSSRNNNTRVCAVKFFFSLVRAVRTHTSSCNKKKAIFFCWVRAITTQTSSRNKKTILICSRNSKSRFVFFWITFIYMVPFSWYIQNNSIRVVKWIRVQIWI